MATLTREKILAAAKAFTPQPIEVPELGGTVYVRPLSLAGMARHLSEPDRHGGAAMAMLLDCVCDETGARIFNRDDAVALAEMPENVARKLVEAINAASGLDAKAVDQAAGK